MITTKNTVIQLPQNEDESSDIDIYRCTVHLDNVKIPFYQKMYFLLNI